MREDRVRAKKRIRLLLQLQLSVGTPVPRHKNCLLGVGKALFGKGFLWV